MDPIGTILEHSYDDWISQSVDQTMNEINIDETTTNEEKEKSSFNKNLVYCKFFYFSYSAAMGSLWPYLPIYFRQLFLTPRQVGAIVACRTITQFLFVPFWCIIAEKYRRHKELLLISLFAWLFSTVGILFVPKEEPKACLEMAKLAEKQKDKVHPSDWFDLAPFKKTNHLFLQTEPHPKSFGKNYDQLSYPVDTQDLNNVSKMSLRRLRRLKDIVATSFSRHAPTEYLNKKDHMSSVKLDHTATDKQTKDVISRHSRETIEVFDDYSPSLIMNTSLDFATIYAEYDPEKHISDTSRPFILLLLITIIGVSLASPAQSLADICTLKSLKCQSQSFGQQAVWAAVGCALFAFLIGSLVNFLTEVNPCNKQRDFNYSPCFYSFAFFMILAIIIATRFDYSTKVAAKTTDLDETIANLRECLRTMNDVHLASLLIVSFYCGFGNGFISTFLFWHLREMGGLQILLACVTLINSTAEVLFYVLSDRLLRYIGHFRLIYLGLFFFSVRFFYYSFLRQPWLVLPIEITHGMTSAAIRSAMISYLRQEGGTGNILHSIFNGTHGGLGFSIGGLVGGFMVHNYGHSITFLIFGEISLLTLFCFILINNIFPYTKHDIKDFFTKQDCMEHD